tara:strand:- start:14893 stop:16080 length:1188 start_codon:yes stop_codon:yes gene_type:complete
VNTHLNDLQPYPFARLQSLFENVQPADRRLIKLSVGEPQHAPPEFVLQAVAANLGRLANYPATAGVSELREAIAKWLELRFALPEIDPETQVLPVNGTREALFAFAQAVIDPGAASLVISPNPFYQIYEGAALLAGAEPFFVNCDAGSGLPDFDSVTPDTWQRCALLYLCSPGNPTGAVMPLSVMQQLIGLAHEHDFVIASDECYSEIYPNEDTPPPGLLEACRATGDTQYRRCVAFHSLSKRSNLPGLRSGFVAGDAEVLREFLKYRTYHGCAMPLHHQLGSIAAWQDEAHVRANRQAYREKFDAVLGELGGCLEVTQPDAGFYLWPSTPGSDTAFARGLYASEGVVVLPGRYLARTVAGLNPGENRVRMALVAELEDCVEAAVRIRRYVEAGA